MILSAIVCLSAFASANNQEDGRVPVVLGTDIGADFDDSFALAYLLSIPQVVDLRLVITTLHNTTGRACIVCKFLQQAGRLDVPVAVGQETPDDHVAPQGVGYLWPWVANYTLERDCRAPLHMDGPSALERELMRGTPENPVYFVSIGAPINLADVLGRANQTDIRGRIRMVAMSGSVFRGYDGYPPPSAEHNVKVNASASRAMYDFSRVSLGARDRAQRANPTWPLVTAPVDTGKITRVDGANFQALLRGAASASGTSRIAASLLEQFRVWYSNGGDTRHYPWGPIGPEVATGSMYDFQTAMLAVQLATGVTQRHGAKEADSSTSGDQGGLLATGLGAPPATPFLRLQPLWLAVNQSGFTNVLAEGSPEGGPVWSATTWRQPSDPAGVTIDGWEVDEMRTMVAGGIEAILGAQ